MLFRRSQAEIRLGAGALQGGQQPAFPSAHGLAAARGEVVQAGQVQPTMHEVEGQFPREGPSALRGFEGGAVHRQANFPGQFAGFIAWESNYIGRRRVVKKIGVELGKRDIGQKRKGDFAGGRARAGLAVEDGEAAAQRRARKAQTWMATVGRPRARRGSGARLRRRRTRRSHWTCRQAAAGWQAGASGRCSCLGPYLWRSRPALRGRDRTGANGAY